jgi:hypothetical protein
MAFAAFLSAQSPPKLTPQHSRLSKNFFRLAADILPEYAKRKPFEVWVQDEGRGGRQWTPTPKWARRRTQPRARRDTRYKQTYIFGGARGTTTGLILLYVNAEAVGLHLDAIAKAVAPGSHALFIADRAGGTKQTACKCQIKLRALHCRRIHHN